MSRVNIDTVRAHQDLNATLEEQAADALSEALDGLDWSAADAVDEVLSNVETFFTAFGEMAVEVARQWYQYCVDTESDGRSTYEATASYDFTSYAPQLKRKVKDYFSQIDSGEKTVDDIKTSLKADLGNHMSAEARRVELDNIIEENRPTVAGRYGRPGKGLYARQNTRQTRVGYARVPTSGCSCAFCMMMASRGFVYVSKKSAGESRKFHDNCRCSIVRLDSDDPIIDDYEDGTQYLDMYYAAAEALESGDLPPEVYKRIDMAREHAKDKDDKDFSAMNEIAIAMRYMYGLQH